MAKSTTPIEVDHFAHDAAKRAKFPTARITGLCPMKTYRYC